MGGNDANRHVHKALSSDRGSDNSNIELLRQVAGKFFLEKSPLMFSFIFGVSCISCIQTYPGAVSGGGKIKKSKRGGKHLGEEKPRTLAFLTFLRPNFFLSRFDFFSAPTNCLWVSEDGIQTPKSEADLVRRSINHFEDEITRDRPPDSLVGRMGTSNLHCFFYLGCKL